MGNLDYNKAVEIAPGVFWVGYNFDDLYFHTNAYVIVDGREAVLIDPGSMVDFDKVLAKVKTVCPIKNVKHIVLQHQDPDLCSSTVAFEKLSDLDVYMEERTSVFARFYGITSFVNLVREDGDSLEFGNGRRLEFYTTPYCHSPGAMATYDRKSGTMFTSDIFGAFNRHWELYADMYPESEHVRAVKSFMQPYMASKEAVMNFISKFEKLGIKSLAPQHGSIIRKDVGKWLDMAKGWEYGTALKGRSGLEIQMPGKFGLPQNSASKRKPGK
jgi:flavorubredoxin